MSRLADEETPGSNCRPGLPLQLKKNVLAGNRAPVRTFGHHGIDRVRDIQYPR